MSQERNNKNIRKEIKMNDEIQKKKLADLADAEGLSLDQLRDVPMIPKLDRNSDPQLIGIYAIYDKKGERYDIPFFMSNDLFAKRRFIMMKDDKESPLSKWPEDFDLMFIALFNILSSEIISEGVEILIQGKKEE